MNSNKFHMTKSGRKSQIPKGNKLANNVGVIPFYTKEAFPKLEKDSSDEDEGEVKKADTTSIPVKIDRAGSIRLQYRDQSIDKFVVTVLCFKIDLCLLNVDTG